MTDGPFTPQDVPPDTDQYVYRYVTRVDADAGMGAAVAYSELQQIRITQP